MSLSGKRKPSPAEGELLFDLDPEPLEDCLTAYAGLPLFVQADAIVESGYERETALASEAAPARLRRSDVCGKLSSIERAGWRLPGGLRPASRRRGFEGNART